jgi:hypothetical protein
MEEEKKKEVKVEKPRRSTKSKVITVMLCVALFCVLSILIFTIFGSDLLPFNQGNDNKQQEEKKEEPKKETIAYELKKDASNNDELYVNGKKIDKINGNAVQKDKIYQIKDALLVIEGIDSDLIYMIDKDGNVFEEISGKLNYGTFFNEVKDDTIYFSSYADVFYQDGSLLCGFKETDVVYVEEKIQYLGNKQFGEQETVSSKTRTQIMQENEKYAVDCTQFTN